jgi:hypothetical protein
MENTIQYGSCSFCGRNDIPICPACGNLCPHGNIPGTWLPCHCGGMGQTTIDHILANSLQEFNERKEVKTDEN